MAPSSSWLRYLLDMEKIHWFESSWGYKMKTLVVDQRLMQLKSAGYDFTDEQIDLVRGMMVEYAQAALEYPTVKGEVYEVLMEMQNEYEESGVNDIPHKGIVYQVPVPAPITLYINDRSFTARSTENGRLDVHVTNEEDLTFFKDWMERMMVLGLAKSYKREMYYKHQDGGHGTFWGCFPISVPGMLSEETNTVEVRYDYWEGK